MTNLKIRADEPTALYRLYDTTGQLLYIGIAYDLKRLEQHALDKDWWPEVARHTVTWYATRPEAGAAEEEAIKAERPRYNRTFRHPKSPRVPEEDLRQRRYGAVTAVRVRLTEDIRAGAFPAGSLLPGVPELCERYGQSPRYVTSALSDLTRPGGMLVHTGRRWVVHPPETFCHRFASRWGSVFFLARHVFKNTPFTVSELADRTKYARRTCSSQISKLTKSGLVENVGTAPAAGRGQRRTLYRISRVVPLPMPEIHRPWRDDLF